ncbi:hypothetical protein R3W88_004829 [Solanum pinnatisectum]|uniref:Uncharacterized protein n=1 Tax=Solanum pinnatisectum TaxID=50273 RepID=A0AAV9KAV5_9SOLN|nr:hypothetical protein R3W88_004829 [Solanum pinnatisectum]
MDIIIVTRFHPGGKFVEGTSGGGLTYIGESKVKYVDPTTNNFVVVDNDFNLLNLIKDLGDGDFLDLYVQHVVDEVEVVKNGVPTGYLCGPTVDESVNEDGVENSHNINVDERLQQGVAQSENINVEVGVDKGLQQGAAQSENINVEVGVDGASDLEGVETNWNISDDSQDSGKQSTSICDDTLIVRKVQEAGRGRGRGKGKGRGKESDDTSTVTRGQQTGRGRGREGASTSIGGKKRPKTVEFGIYTDNISGRQTLNPGTSSERVVTPVVFKYATPTNIDIDYKPRGLKWKGKYVVTTPQLQRMSKSKRGGSANV